jgi:hypothetical protein
MHALLMLSAVTAAVDNPVKGVQGRPSDDADRKRNRFLETIQSFYQNWVLSTLLSLPALPKSRYPLDFGSVRT